MIKIEINTNKEDHQKNGALAFALEASSSKDYPSLDLLYSMFEGLGLKICRAGFISTDRLVVHVNTQENADIIDSLLDRVNVSSNA